MKNWLQEQAEINGEGLALAFGDRQWTYRELCQEVQRFAAQLEKQGLKSGQSVALIGQNSDHWVITAHAVWWLGATVVGLHHLASSDELGAQIAAVEPVLVVGDQRFEPVLQRYVENKRWLSFDELAGEAQADAVIEEAQGFDDEQVLTILFTSGSTGQAKAVPLTVKNHHASAEASKQRIGSNGDDRWLCCLSLCHIGGLAIVIRSAIYGTAVELVPAFDVDEVLNLLGCRPITMASLVPTMLTRLLSRSGDELHTNLRCVLIGGGPIDDGDLRQARQAGFPVAPTYGMTEGCSQLATLPHDAPPELLITAGRPLDGVELTIVDENRQPLAPGKIGRILVRGPMVFAGYLGGDEGDDRAGWFDTGDFGSVDEQGFLTIAHRRGMRIVSGGENIAPTEVERVLRQAPQVDDVAVVGVDDPHWGQVVAALIVPAGQGKTPSVDWGELQSLCRSQLAAYKVPRRWAQSATIPRGATGKIDRDEIRKIFESTFKTNRNACTSNGL